MINFSIIFPRDSEALFNFKSERTFGGASVQLLNISRGLNNCEGVSVSPLICNYGPIEEALVKEFPPVLLYNEKDTAWRMFFKFSRYITKNRPHVIIQRGLTYMSCILAFYCYFKNIKFFFMFAHDLEACGKLQKNSTKCRLFFLLKKYATTLIVQNNYQLEQLPLHIKKVLIRSGYPIPVNDDAHKKTILWVSRLEPWKQPEYFIKLADDFPDIDFIMIAPLFHRYQEYGENIHQQARKIKNITLIDFVHFSEINHYFRDAQLFVNTSSREGFPNTFIQAMVHKTPILSLNVDPDNIIENKKCGIYCQGKYKHLKEGVIKITSNQDFASKLRNNAYSYAKENHDIKKIAQQIIELLH